MDLNVIVLLLTALAVIGLLGFSVRREVSAPWNAPLLGSLPVLACLIIARAAGISNRNTAYLVVGFLAGTAMISLIAALTTVLIGRESASPKSVRLLGLGLVVLVIYLIGSVVFVREFVHIDLTGVGLGLLGVITIVGGYLLAMALGYLLHALIYRWKFGDLDPDFIVVNGARLVEDQLTPLLTARLDKAIEGYNRGGGRATIIPSGGWTSGDERSEADAMIEYLLAKAIPASQIVPEDQSTTTMENLKNSREIIKLRSGASTAEVASITSDYHVYRTVLIARSVGLRAQGLGSSTPVHLLPEAILREIAALFWMHKLWHASLILVVTLFYQVVILPSGRYSI